MRQGIFLSLSACLLVGFTSLGASESFAQLPEAPRDAATTPNEVLAAPTPTPLPGLRATPGCQPIDGGSAGLTIGELEQMAMANNPTLAQAAHRVAALQGEQLQVGLYPNPVVGYQAEEIGDSGGAGQHGMFFSQEVVTANKLGLNRAVASQEVQQAE